MAEPKVITDIRTLNTVVNGLTKQVNELVNQPQSVIKKITTGRAYFSPSTLSVKVTIEIEKPEKTLVIINSASTVRSEQMNPYVSTVGVFLFDVTSTGITLYSVAGGNPYVSVSCSYQIVEYN